MTRCPMDAVEVDLDLFSPTTREADDQAWASAREAAPVVWTESGGGHWLVTRYEEVCDAFRNWEKFSSARRDPGRGAISVLQGPSPLLVPEELDPPEWHPMRRVLAALLKPAHAEQLRPRVREWARHFVDQFAAAGRCDLVNDLVVPLPASVTMEFLGFPKEEWLPFATVFHDISAYTKGHPVREAAFGRYGQVMDAIAREIDRRRVEPGDDMITAMMQSRHDGVEVDETMLRHLIFMVMAGGVDTTTSLASAAFVHLGRDLALRRRLREKPALLVSATEEFLRMHPPARTHARTVAADVEFAGCKMSEGDRIVLSELSANYDERAFAEPGKFDPERFPNRHVAFGMGIHRCPGSHIARVMFTEMVTAVLERMPDYVLDEAGLTEYPSWTMMGGWARIPITFSAERF